MRKKFLYVLFLPAFFLCGCSNDDGGKLPSDGIELSEGTSTRQEIFADQTTTGNKGISFTASGPWRAVVEEVPMSREAGDRTVDWVGLSQYSGDQAGSYTLAVSLSPNYTGSARQAVVRIICGDTEITITIVQKGEVESGQVPRMVKTLYYKEEYGSEADTYWGDPEETRTTYAYDERGRVARVVYESLSGGSHPGEVETYTFDYGVVGEITITRRDKLDGSTTMLVAKLDGAGRVVELKEGDSYESGDSYTFGYNEDGRLAKVAYDDGGNWDKFSYTDGLLTGVTSWWNGEEEVSELPVQTLYPNRYPANLTNIDLNAADWFGETELDLLYGMRLFGTGSSCLREVSLIYDDESDVVSPGQPGYPTPGVTIKKEYTTVREREEEGHDQLVYEFDEGYVSRFYSEQSYDIMRVTYDIVVGYELVDPEHPEAGYKGEIKNRKETKTGSDKNIYTYTVDYVK